MFDMWILELQITGLVMENGLKTKDLKTPGFVETGDDTTHLITQIGKVPLSMQDGQTKYLKDVLHVPTITKKLVSVGQMVE
jgi:hypothetical protein